MLKPKSIQINIPHPCSQSWEEMTPGTAGRHCDHCRKSVIDFTTWSDAALYNFLSKNNEHVCGRFLSSQINHPINIPYQPHSQLYRLTIALGLTLIFSQIPKAVAQNNPTITNQPLRLNQPVPNTIVKRDTTSANINTARKTPDSIYPNSTNHEIMGDVMFYRPMEPMKTVAIPIEKINFKKDKKHL